MGVGQIQKDHEKVKEQGERVNEEGKQMEAAVAAGDEGGGDVVEDGDGVAVIVVACGDEKDTVGEKDEGVEKEDHALMEGMVGVVDETQKVAAVEH